MHPEERVARRARMQRGLITHHQAVGLGMTPRTIENRVTSGTWRIIRPGVYVVGGAPPSWEQTLLAVTLPFDDCWIAHGTSSKLLEMRHTPQLGGIEVLRPYGRYRRLDGVIAHRSRIITPADVTRHRGIPVMSVARTIVEVSGRLDVKQTGKLIDDAMRKNKLALEHTRAAFARLAAGGRRRKQSIRAALAARLPGYDPGESDLELRALQTILRAGLPMPVQQHRVVINGKRYRIDLAYPPDMVAIELVGWDPHSGRESFDDDKARAGDLVSIGWRVLEVTSRHEDDDIVRRVGGTLAVARAA